MSIIPEIQGGAILAVEQIYLGSLLLDSNLWDLVELDEDDFFYAIHCNIFNKLRWFARNPDNFPVNKLIDELSVEFIQDKHNVRKYLIGLLENVKSTNNFISYQDIIREKSVYRKLKELSKELSMEL